MRTTSSQSVLTNRRGIAMIIVMLAVSTALVISLSFMQSQQTSLQIGQNVKRGQLALEAARTGATVALADMQSASWAGVQTPLTRTMLSEQDGEVSYTVTYHAVESSDTLSPLAAAFRVRVLSTGSWVPTDVSLGTVSREVEFVAELRPRLPGRTVGEGDFADVDDLADPIGDFMQLQEYAATAHDTGDSLSLNPRQRIDGDIYISGAMNFFESPDWSDSIRNEYLDSVGTVLGTADSRVHPHPLTGTVRTNSSFDSALVTDFGRVGVPSETTSTLSVPSYSNSAFTSYQVFEGGFTYSAGSIASSIPSNTTYVPTDSNPLGILYNTSNRQFGNDVVIVGTVINMRDVTVNGDRILISPPDWRGSIEGMEIDNPDLWPRLPAVITGDDFNCGGISSCTINGVVITNDDFKGSLSDYEYITNFTPIWGTATAQPSGDGKSLVSFQSSVNLSSVPSDAELAITVGSAELRYFIKSVDDAADTVTILGEAVHDSPVWVQVRPDRHRSLDVHGSVIAGSSINITAPPSWDNFSSSGWAEKFSEWESYNAWMAYYGWDSVEFATWLSSYLSWWGDGNPMQTYGMGLEPTFHIYRPSNSNCVLQPPLFRPSPGNDSGEGAGYRWEILSWKEET
ncbi:hypothetical protein [Calycomorphotria hydatis]|uniref:Uncharacterized protein n=1 Tax=Calycomorphotria hydatis TaxID=2528027 RepID=A0A517TF28_9PLAN|nr:hypothetical protein [Calycomorphotria hydatis]QDT66975.1 hypothetical protein V22_42470 [Calycomorphotria hydatis]